MRLSPFLALLSVALFGASPVLARTNAGDVLWEARGVLTGTPAAIAADHGRAVVVGKTLTAAGDTDFVVAALDQKTGVLLWRDQLDVTGGDDEATIVAMDGQHVVVAGVGADGGSGLLLLRVYDPKSGELEWDARASAARVTGLAMDGGHIVVTGRRAVDSRTAIPFVRAYVTKTGALLWKDDYPPVAAGFAFARRAVALQGGVAYTAETLVNPDPISSSRCLLRAYKSANGRLTWESETTEVCRVYATATDGRHFFIAGQAGVSEDDFGAWAFDAKTGVELWSARSFIPAGHQNVALAVDAEKGRVFAAGYVESNQGFGINEAFFVRGHDADNGELLWEEQFHTVRCDCRALDILADHGRVFAAGGDGDQTWLIRAYDERLGTVLWHDEFEVPGPPPEVGRGFDATAIAIDGGRLFVVGSALNASGGMDVILRAYDAK